MTSITYLQSLFLTCITLLSLFPKVSISVSTLFPNQSLTDNQTLVSEGQHFELGFFSPGYTKNRYLGIWYKKISPLVVVWVANRNIPLTNASGVLKMDENGNLVLLNHEKWVVWSSNQSHIRSPIAEKLVAKLLDSGNLVVTKEREDDHQTSYQWESFCHVTDTLLQGMKLGWDTETGVNNSLTSWKSVEDPSKGDYSLVASPYGSPEIYLLQDQTPIYRSGPWNGIMFSGIPHLRSGDGFMINMILNKNQNYYSFEVDESIISRVVVDETGKLKKFVWLGDEHGWTPYWDAPLDRCDTYKECGPYGVCSIDNSPVCNCLRGFEPRYEREWKLTDGSGGCVRKTKFECARDDGFLKLTRMKLPDCSRTYYNQSINLKECKEMCLKNCSCTAYANSDVRNGGGGCIIWIGDLFDLKQFPNGGQDLYVRVATSELDKSNQLMAIIITATAVSITLLLGLIICFIRKKRTLKRTEKDKASRMKSQELALIDMFSSEEHKNDDLELPLIDFDTVSATTENFSEANKIGEGGFGSVYKGTLANGQQVAVKRLSKDSGQGVDEFKNEVTLIAKLQHRNLVRLLGCCIYGEEKLLIYEYMPNKSLDFLLFDKTKSMTLDWEKRFNIIVGIARGLLYLHQDSRFRIIHRDLKASNVLLDDEMDPKISDFGMARIFGSHQTEANTCRVVGTYGYMSPEYAMDGIYSAKSDVFSYGVLVLEIISGKKNRGFHSSSTVLNLLGYAWKLWEEDKSLEIMDESLSDICSIYEVLKCIQIGLLCVQEVAEDRPSMSSVVLMLGSETATLAQPKQPGFSFGRIPTETYSSSNDQETGSVDYATVTMVDSR